MLILQCPVFVIIVTKYRITLASAVVCNNINIIIYCSRVFLKCIDLAFLYSLVFGLHSQSVHFLLTMPSKFELEVERVIKKIIELSHVRKSCCFSKIFGNCLIDVFLRNGKRRLNDFRVSGSRS